MHQFKNYDIYIFDCDGVLIDSNKLKISAMKDALENFSLDKEAVMKCINYFTENFGKSRFHHVDYFINNILNMEDELTECDAFKSSLLKMYSENVDKSYSDALIIPGVVSMLGNLSGDLFVASGTEHQQLKRVLKLKAIEIYFQGIFGSPISKTEIVANIISRYTENTRAVLVGDSKADFEAANSNGIDFIGISGYSNTPEMLKHLCQKNKKLCIEYWIDINDESNK